MNFWFIPKAYVWARAHACSAIEKRKKWDMVCDVVIIMCGRCEQPREKSNENGDRSKKEEKMDSIARAREHAERCAAPPMQYG